MSLYIYIYINIYIPGYLYKCIYLLLYLFILCIFIFFIEFMAAQLSLVAPASSELSDDPSGAQPSTVEGQLLSRLLLRATVLWIRAASRSITPGFIPLGCHHSGVIIWISSPRCNICNRLSLLQPYIILYLYMYKLLFYNSRYKYAYVYVFHI